MGHLTMAAMSANDPKRTLRRLDHAGRVTVGLVADALFTSDALKLILIYFRFVRERTRTYSLLLAPTLGEVEMANKRSHSDAARIKRRTLSVKTKRKQPFDLDSFLSHANRGRTKAKYRKNETIFRQGDPTDAVFYIIDGECKVTVVSEKGKEAVVALHEKGDFFGEGCLTGQPRRIATVTAITVCEIMRFDKATMMRALHEPNFSELFMSHLLARTVRVEADLVDQLFNSSEKRLARLLLLMANFGKEGRPEPVIVKVSQETLAEMIGTTRSRVSFLHEQIQEIGLHRLQRRLRSP